jgi:hypothetical protein
MTEAPQIQAILSSCNVSGREAESIISKYLVAQKKYLSSADIDEVAPSNSDEEYFDVEDNNAGGTFEEIQSRLEGIVRSLSKRSPTKEESASNFPISESHTLENVDASSRKKLKKEAKRAKKSSMKKRKQEGDSISERKKIKREE